VESHSLPTDFFKSFPASSLAFLRRCAVILGVGNYLAKEIGRSPL
jgi:hypothetical protein